LDDRKKAIVWLNSVFKEKSMKKLTPPRQFGPLSAARVISLASVLMLPISLLAPKGIAPLFVITALLVIGLNFDRYLNYLKSPRFLSVLLGLCIAFVVLSTFWSVTPSATFLSAMIFGLTCIGGLAIVLAARQFTTEEHALFTKATIYGGVIGIVFFSIEFAIDGSIKQILSETFTSNIRPRISYDPSLNSGMAVYALYVWPWAVAMKKRLGFVALALALAVSIVAVAIGQATSPILALGIGLIVAAGVWWSEKLVTSLCAVFIIIGIFAMPYLPGSLPNPETETHRLSFLSRSALHRLSIWNTVVDRMAERPLLGFGMNTTRSLYSDKDKINRVYFPDNKRKKWYNFFEPIPLHAHNGILQIWLELGIGGALLLAAMVLSIIKFVRDSLRHLIWKAACMGLLTSSITIFSISFGPWQSWWQATLWLLTGFMVALRNSTDAIKNNE
jgi:exopolysaccharide production protein ExoQ